MMLKGHGLFDEGRAYVSRSGDAECCAKVRQDGYSPGSRVWGTRSDFGHAQCYCGEQSPHLPSNNKRKEWHREHKQGLFDASITTRKAALAVLYVQKREETKQARSELFMAFRAAHGGWPASLPEDEDRVLNWALLDAPQEEA